MTTALPATRGCRVTAARPPAAASSMSRAAWCLPLFLSSFLYALANLLFLCSVMLRRNASPHISACNSFPKPRTLYVLWQRAGVRAGSDTCSTVDAEGITWC